MRAAPQKAMLRCRSPTLLTLRMLLSSPSTSRNPNTNSNLTCKPTSRIPKSFHRSSDLSLFSNPHPFRQTMALVNCCSSNTTHTVPISTAPESGNPEPDSVSGSLVVVSFYKFADFPDHADMRKPLKELCEELVLITLSLFYYCVYYGYDSRHVVSIFELYGFTCSL